MIAAADPQSVTGKILDKAALEEQGSPGGDVRAGLVRQAVCPSGSYHL